MQYDLGQLGWLQFQRLCDLAAEAEAGIPLGAWTGEADGAREAALDREVEIGGERLPAPVLLRCAYAGDRLARHRVVGRAAGAPQPAATSVVILTDAPLTERGKARVATWIGPRSRGARTVVLDGNALGELLDARPEIRLALPSVLGLRRLDGWLDPARRARSTLDVGAAHALARVFVPTQPHAAALGVLAARRLAVLTGPPEMGKTAIARMIALARLAEGWEAHECTSPDELWSALDPDVPQVFVADDAFGSTEYRPQAAEAWARELPAILRRLDDRHWLIWTSRPTPLRAGLDRMHRERGLERFPAPAEVQIDAAALSVREKALILFRHARAASLPARSVQFLRERGPEVVAHRHFTPERIRRMVAALPEAARGPREEAAAAAAALGRPTVAMRTSFVALEPEQQAVLRAMLDQPPGPVAERDLAAALRRIDPGAHHDPHALTDRLQDHFLRVVANLRVDWVHPSWRDVVIDHLAADDGGRRAFLRGCGLDGTLLAVSVGGGPAGERRLPLLRDEGDYDALADRLGPLVRELDEPGRAALLRGLEAAVLWGRDAQESEELEALAGRALTALRTAWAREPPSADGLAAWHGLADRLRDPPAPAPDPGRTWAALLPTAPPQLDDLDALDQFGDWLLLAYALLAREPERLAAYGFREAGPPSIARFLDVVDAAGRAVPAPAGDRLPVLLHRIGALVPKLRPRAAAAAIRIERSEGAEDAPAPEPPPLPGPPPSEAADVDRILRDLA